jgi:hypothetical protein
VGRRTIGPITSDVIPDRATADETTIWLATVGE